ncbi:MAG: mitochondrial fission ELM1 family protein [bacterium]|jgi:hypothetical protein
MRGLILSDGKPGHFNQSRALCALLGLAAHETQIEFKSELREQLLRARMNLSQRSPSNIPELLGLLGYFVSEPCLTALQSMLSERPDVIVSAGSTLAATNLLIARAVGGKSIAMMRPNAIPLESFDVIVMPEHDRRSKNPANAVFTPVALSYFDAARIETADAELARRFGCDVLKNRPIALIVGGNSKVFDMTDDDVLEAAEISWSWASKQKCGLVGTTSRRTAPSLERKLQAEFEKKKDAHWIWGRTDTFNPLPALLPRASAAVVTEDSISMISEAIIQGHRPLVLELKKRRASAKLAKFKKYLIDQKLARWVQSADLAEVFRAESESLSKSPTIDLAAIRDEIMLKLGWSHQAKEKQA